MASDAETSLGERTRETGRSVGRSTAGNDGDALVTVAGVLVVMAVLYDVLGRDRYAG